MHLFNKLGDIGRFQTSVNDVVRYIIGDIEGIMFIINLVHGKHRTPASLVFLF